MKNTPVPRSRVSLLYLGIVFFFLSASSTTPSPLYSVYQRHWGFSSLMLTEIFAVYSAAMLVTLLVFGKISNFIGRKPVIAASLVLNFLAMAVFIHAEGVFELFTARVLQGISVAAALSAASAMVLDILPPNRSVAGSLINVAAPLAGLAAGALLASVFIDFLPDPEKTIYFVLAAVFLVTLSALVFIPETARRRPGACASLRPYISVPDSSRASFSLALLPLVAVWAMAGLYQSLGPSLVAMVTGSRLHVVGGLTIFVMASSGTLVIVAAKFINVERVLFSSFPLMVLGVLITVFAVYRDSTLWLFLGTVCAGLGWGGSFSGVMADVTSTAEEEHRAGLVSALYLVCYLAFGLPAIAAGFAVSMVGLSITAIWYGILIAVLISVSALCYLVAKRSHRPDQEICE